MDRASQILVSVVFISIISGCSTNNISADEGHTNSSLAVLHAYDPRQKEIEYGSFRSVDGKRLNCSPNCPQSVHVQPGAHTFVLKVKSVESNVDGTTYSFEVEVPVIVKNMQAGKVYTVKYMVSRHTKRLSARVDHSPSVIPRYVNTSSSNGDQVSIDTSRRVSSKKGFISKNKKFNISGKQRPNIKSPTSIVKNPYNSTKQSIQKKTLPNQNKLFKNVKPKWKKPF